PFETGGRPEGLRVVVDLERRHRVRELDPGQLGAGKDMDVGCHRRRLVERAAPHESNLGTAVLAEDRHLTGRTAEDELLAAVVARRLYGFRLAPEQRDTVGLDQEVDHESASGLALAVEAVAAVDEERIGGQPVANRTTGAAAFPKPFISLLPRTVDEVWTISRLPQRRSDRRPAIPVVPARRRTRARSSPRRGPTWVGARALWSPDPDRATRARPRRR